MCLITQKPEHIGEVNVCLKLIFPLKPRPSRGLEWALEGHRSEVLQEALKSLSFASLTPRFVNGYLTH